MQTEIFKSMPLLDQNGCLSKPGWARKPFWKYDKAAISAPWYRIKEWDYYYVMSDSLQVGLAITISDLGYAGLCAICWIDLASGKTYQAEALVPFPRGKLGLDADSQSSKVQIEQAGLTIDYRVEDGVRRLIFSAPNLEIGDAKGITGQVEISAQESHDSLNIASSWQHKPKAFYYNRKINSMQATGVVHIGAHTHSFAPENCQAGLDWGRGNWTYKNRWFWASANGHVNGKPLGINLGYGFSDRSNASENVVFYDGVAHKLDEIQFHFDTDNYLAPWKTKSSDGRLKLSFLPVVDRSSETNLLLIRSKQHQVFGHFSGTIELDGGETLVFDKVLGFAEDVFNCF